MNMKSNILLLGALMLPSNALAQEGPAEGPVIAASNSTMLVKMTNSASSTDSKPGDKVTGILIDPRDLRGATVEGMVIRADHAILNFAFDTLHHQGKTYRMQSRLVSVTSSKGNDGMDDLDQRLRIEGVGIIAYGTRTAIDEGAEIRITAWQK
jgi:hypothetical protein